MLSVLFCRRYATTLPISCSSVRELGQPPADGDLRTGLRRSTTQSPEFAAAKRVVLVRHGQSTWNKEGRIQGSSDYSVLTDKGELQAETSRQMLLGDSFDVCFTSPLIRSKRTAEIIWCSRKKEMITLPDLREIDLYSFQGLLKHEGKEKFGSAYHQWQKDAANFQIDGHYPVRELWDRAESSWNKILAHEGKSVLLVAHNAVNQALVATAIGLETKYFRILLQSNCGVSVLDFIPRIGGGSPHINLNRLNQVQESADCLGVDRVPHYVEVKKMLELEVEPILEQAHKNSRNAGNIRLGWLDGLEDTSRVELWTRSRKAWQCLLEELSRESESERNVVVVAHPGAHIALIAHCLELTFEWLGSFHLDNGSISVIDFPDRTAGKGVIRCINYTAHLGRWSIPVTRSLADD